MKGNTTKSEKERARFKKCRRDLLNINFDLIYHALNTLIKPTKVMELKRLSRPEEKNQFILESVEDAIEDEAMFKKFQTILEELTIHSESSLFIKALLQLLYQSFIGSTFLLLYAMHQSFSVAIQCGNAGKLRSCAWIHCLPYLGQCDS